MRLTVNSPDGSVVFPVDVPDDMELENFLALAQAEIPTLAAVPVRQLSLFHNARMITDYGKSLKDCGITNGDLVMVSLAGGSTASVASNPAPQNSFGIDFSSIQIPGGNAGRGRRPQQGTNSRSLTNDASGGMPGIPNAAALRQMLLADPNSMAALRERNPALAEALNNPAEFERIFNEQIGARQAAAMRRMQMITANPFDPEVQRLIEEEIQQHEIDSHMEVAMEHMPEAFAMVPMLYIRLKVNGHEVKAFVDSGAQATIMSEPCAQRCNITRFIDRRFSGIARGVGTSKIIGRVHMAQLQIENDFLPTTFNVLEDQGVDMLFGLDMLKRHQCIIDLKNNVLVIGTTGTQTPFLPESELPEARHHRPESPMAEDRHLAEVLERSAAEAETASLSAAVAASNVRRSTSVPHDSTAATTQTAGTSGATASASENPSASPESVQRLVDMGYQRDDAIRELIKSGGDLNKAAMSLIASALPAPPPPKKK